LLTVSISQGFDADAHILVPDLPDVPNYKGMSVTADYFQPELDNLKGSRIRKEDMMAFLAKMKRVGSVNVGRSSARARADYERFAPRAEKWLDRHPDIAAQVHY